jgi:hypothetical protein
LLSRRIFSVAPWTPARGATVRAAELGVEDRVSF